MSRIPFLLLAAGALGPVLGSAEELRAGPAESVLTLRTTKAGPLGGLAHDHRFVPERWRAAVSFQADRLAPTEVEVVVDAASLHDHEPRLKERSRADVDETAAGPEVLDARRFPQIRYHGRAEGPLRAAADGGLEGVLHGTLTLHGASGPLDVPFHVRADGGAYRASGVVSFRQTAFGMRPYSTALGTIGVDDLVRLEFDLVLRPVAGGAPSAASGGDALRAGSGGP